MHSNEWKIYKAEGKAADSCKVEVKAFLAHEAVLFRFLSFRLKGFGIRKAAFGEKQKGDGTDGGQQQKGEGRGTIRPTTAILRATV